MFNPAQQHRLIGLSGPSSGIVLSLQSSVIYVGSALGASVGGAVVRFATVGQIGYFAGAMTVLSLAVFAASLRLERRVKDTRPPQTRRVPQAKPDGIRN
ncbi:hypothetical protein CM49_05700 [Paenibacillus sp. P1XP2]|nr:hypothetical protein CM49_05700 [Paenibacillus sp. P1XP2]